jgi:hypothetical protein
VIRDGADMERQVRCLVQCAGAPFSNRLRPSVSNIAMIRHDCPQRRGMDGGNNLEGPVQGGNGAGLSPHGSNPISQSNVVAT